MYSETNQPRSQYIRAEKQTPREIENLEDLPSIGGPYTLPEGTVLYLQKPGEKKVLTEAMNVVIGPPSHEIVKCRKLDITKIGPDEAKTLSPFETESDRRDVIVNGKVIGYVYGDEIYLSVKYPDD